jgi:hypothetical protein
MTRVWGAISFAERGAVDQSSATSSEPWNSQRSRRLEEPERVSEERENSLVPVADFPQRQAGCIPTLENVKEQLNADGRSLIPCGRSVRRQGLLRRRAMLDSAYLCRAIDLCSPAALSPVTLQSFGLTTFPQHGPRNCATTGL